MTNQVVNARRAGFLAVAIALFVNLLALFVWDARGLYGLTGDEPHYLVISDALWSFGSFDVSAAYVKEALIPTLYPLGLAPDGVAIGTDWSWAHIVQSSNGIFSWHGVLVGWLLALPLGIFGILGAKITMVLLGAAIVWVVYLLSGLMFTSVRARFLVSLTLGLTYPLLLASNQIFPDLPAGGLALLGVYWIYRCVKGVQSNSRLASFAVAFLVALMPWIGIKYAPVAAVLLIGMLVVSRHRIAIALAAGLSAVLLMVFQGYAYGSPLGAFAEGVVEYGPEFWLRLAGLVIDQNQGLLLYSPILWLGLIGVVFIYRESRLLGVVWSLSVLLFLLPSAAHPGSYGGGSFIGRYGWGVALLFFVPTLLVLARLPKRWLIAVSGLSLLFSLWIFITQVFIGGSFPGGPVALDLYTKPAETWLESYSIFYFPLQQFFPALYNIEWAWGFWTNWVWLILAVALVLWRFLSFVRAWMVLPVVALVVVSGLISRPGTELVEVKHNISATVPGVVSDGPAWNMREGNYEWSVTYRSTGDVPVAGKWELLATADASTVAAGELPATGGAESTVSQVIPFRSFQPRGFLLRVSWYGDGGMEVISTAVARN